eukprot:223020-Rhodomonas_salina.1
MPQDILRFHAVYWPAMLMYTPLPAYAPGTTRPVLTARTALPAYAMRGTDAVYPATCLRTCYAMSNTDLAYGATTRSADVPLPKYIYRSQSPLPPTGLKPCKK